jgi:DNA (cytosine-5)-methyltransferase 1
LKIAFDHQKNYGFDFKEIEKIKRKDGKPKLRANRAKPEYDFGFANNSTTHNYRNSNCDGILTDGNLKCVSLFSGCGGFDLSFLGGFEYLGKLYKALPIDIICAIDNLPDAVECYNLNIGNHCLEADLTTIPISDLPSGDILLGGFPCQDFSSSGPKTGLNGHRGQLYRVMVDYMKEYQPKVVVAENVAYLARLRDGEYLETILADFEAEGYHFDVWEMYAPDYGLSQSRRRLFLIGVRDDCPGYPIIPRKTHAKEHIPISRALGDLENVTDETVTNQSQFFIATKATSGGGQGDHTNKPDKVAYCIRANSRGRIQFHYKLNRRLTVRECARLQSFPDQFVFPFTTQRNLTLIGNAVPPILGYRVAESVLKYLKAANPDSYDESTSSPLAVDKSIQLTREYVSQLSLVINST